jgi:hypothetical protein
MSEEIEKTAEMVEKEYFPPILLADQKEKNTRKMPACQIKFSFQKMT